MNGQSPVEEQALETALYNSSNTVEQLISQLSAASSSTDAKHLTAEIQEQMSIIRARIRDLEGIAEEQDMTDETDRLVSKVSSYKRGYESLQVSLRKANLQRRKNVELAAAGERRALLGTADPLQRQRKLESEADLSKAAEDITASLQRTRQQMIEELDHTSATLAAMDISDKTLNAAKDEFSGQKTSFRRSHKLLGTMRRHSLLDTLTLWGGMAFFMLVVAYIVLKRSYYFVPGFAKSAFRSSPRNATSTNVAPSKEDALAGEGWVQGDGGYPITSDSGAQLPDSDRDLDARLDALVKPDSDLFQAPANLEQDPALHSKAEGLDSQEGLPPPEDTKEGEAHTEPDLTEAHDEAGAADVDADALQRAYVDRLRAMEAQQGAAHPGFGAGMASMAMQGRTAADVDQPGSMSNASGATASSAADNASIAINSSEMATPPLHAADVGPEDVAKQIEEPRGSGARPVDSPEQDEESVRTAELSTPGKAGVEEEGSEEETEALSGPPKQVADQEAEQTADEGASTEAEQAAKGADDASPAASEAIETKEAEDEEAGEYTNADDAIIPDVEESAEESAETCDAGQCAAEDTEGRLGAEEASTPADGEDVDADYLDPVTDRSLPFKPGAERGSRDGLEEDAYTTRQEDTELGIFRPDDIE